MFYVAIVIFIGLTITAKNGIDRLIYGALAAAVAAAFLHFQGMPAASTWSF